MPRYIKTVASENDVVCISRNEVLIVQRFLHSMQKGGFPSTCKTRKLDNDHDFLFLGGTIVALLGAEAVERGLRMILIKQLQVDLLILPMHRCQSKPFFNKYPTSVTEHRSLRD